LRILALDFDGTIALDDKLDQDAAEAIREARASGLLVILVTGRILDDLDAILPETALFDAVVGENGGVLRFSGETSPIALGRGPDPKLLAELERRGIPHRGGICVVEASADAAPQILGSIHRLGLPLGISFNRGKLMVLPLGVTKGSGLNEVLWRLRASAHNAVAIGDGENDHPLLEACEFGAAVAWGSDSLRRVADHVIRGDGPSAVAGYVRGLLSTRRIPLAFAPRRSLRLGTLDDGEPLDLALRGRNMLIGGDPKSGKSWVAGLVCEQLILQRYSVCILDPEGDYACLESLPGVIVYPIDSDDSPLSGLERLLTHPDLSVVVDMSAAAPAAKAAVVRRVLELVNKVRRKLGLPHRIVIDEAHYFLGRLDDPELFDRELGGHLLVTYRISDLSADVLGAADAVIVTQVADQRQALALRGLGPPVGTTSEWLRSLASLAIDEALLLPGAPETGDRLTRFRIAPRATAHVRHRQKYCEIPVPPGREFVFTRQGRATGQRAHSISDLFSLLPELPDDVFRSHLARGDFHRWVERVFSDAELGDAIRRAERLEGQEAREAVARAIWDRYGGEEHRGPSLRRNVS
jgi:hypothetical protein